MKPTRTGLALATLGVLASSRLAPAQCPDGTPLPCAGQAARTPAPRSIAVLTFENTTRDTSAQYLAEGLADQIFARLGSVERLTLISRSAVRRLHSPEQLSVQQLGRALNAAYLVNGSLRAAGGRVRVTAEALRAATGEAVWVATYDRAGDDLIGIEEAVATEVAAGVAGRLSPQERRALGSRATANSRAYEQFLRGNVLLARRSPASLQAAIMAYRTAIAADSGFADGYARLAYAYAACADIDCGDADSLHALARQATERALQLNPRSSDAWMGRAFLLYGWSLFSRVGRDDSALAALAAFRRGVELNPRNEELWAEYASALSLVNDSAALRAARRALAIDPTRAAGYAALAVPYYLMGRTERALAVVDSAVALEPDATLRTWRVLYRLAAGDTAGALADARLLPGVFYAREVLAAFARDSAASRQVESDLSRPQCYRVELAMYLAWTARREQAVQWFLGCGPSLYSRWFLRFPALAPLADDPRIRALRAASDSILARARWR